MSSSQVAHPATLKKALRDKLAVDRVLTTGQVKRWGLVRAAEYLGLEPFVLSGRTVSNDQATLRDLEFVTMDVKYRSRPVSVLQEWAALAELRHWFRAIALDFTWQHIDLGGRTKTHLPDLQIRFTDGSAWAVEVDSGYDQAKRVRKLEAFSASGYSGIIWISPIRVRSRDIVALAHAMSRKGELAGIDRVLGMYCNYWSPIDPYRGWPHSDLKVSYTFRPAQERVRGSGARLRVHVAGDLRR